jgi:ADP-ribose pyrophosphatase
MPRNTPPAWQHVDTRVVFEHPRITVSEDTVVLPSGRETKWMHFREGPDFVKLICTDDQERVLVVYSYAHPPRQVVQEFPGGLINPGESTEEAARRELAEEVGLRPHVLQPIGTFLDNTRRSDRRCTVFWATDFEVTSTKYDEEEFIEYEWLPISTFEAMIRAGEVLNVTMLAAWTIFKLRERGETNAEAH